MRRAALLPKAGSPVVAVVAEILEAQQADGVAPRSGVGEAADDGAGAEPDEAGGVDGAKEFPGL